MYCTVFAQREGREHNYVSQNSTGAVKFVPRSPIPSIHLPKEGLEQPRPRAATTETRRVRCGTNAIGITSGFLVAPGGSHTP